MKRAVVLGMARSGQAAAALLERNGVEVVRVDRELGNDEDLSLLEGADVLVKSPGVPRSNALVAAARVPIWSEVELAAHYLPNPILGVTGTNGKTTTVEWSITLTIDPKALPELEPRHDQPVKITVQGY